MDYLSLRSTSMRTEIDHLRSVTQVCRFVKVYTVRTKVYLIRREVNTHRLGYALMIGARETVTGNSGTNYHMQMVEKRRENIHIIHQDNPPLAGDPPHPQRTPIGTRILPLPLLPRAMQLKSNIMLFRANFSQLLLKRLLPLFCHPGLLKVGE